MRLTREEMKNSEYLGYYSHTKNGTPGMLFDLGDECLMIVYVTGMINFLSRNVSRRLRKERSK